MSNRKVSDLTADAAPADDSLVYLATAGGAARKVTVANLRSTVLSAITETIQDAVGSMTTDGTTVNFTYDDTAGTLTAEVQALTSANLSDFADAVRDVESLTHPVDVSAYATPALAFAAAVSGDVLYFPPSPSPYNSTVGLSVPDGVGISGYGARLRFTTAAGLQIDNPTEVYAGLIIDGNDLSPTPLKIGTGAGGLGSKAVFRDITVKKAATAGTVCEIHNLQNSVFVNFRLSDSVNATTGLLIDNGSKNLTFDGGLWPTQVNGPCLRITTSGGSQRTSKITVNGGLSEITEGVRLEDCEQVKFNDWALNGGGADQAFHLIAGGNRNGAGPNLPSDITVNGGQIKSWDNAFHVAGPMTSLQVGGCTLEVTNVYKVEDAAARITEIAPHFATNATRFVSVAGAVEGTVVQAFQAQAIITDHSNTGSTETITFTGSRSIHHMRLNAATVTITLAGAVNGRYTEAIVRTLQDATGGRLWALPAAVLTDAGADVQPSAAAGAVDWWRIWTIDGGTSYVIERIVAAAA